MIPLMAGFESAMCHWNGHRTLESTGHCTAGAIEENYWDAYQRGARGFRDAIVGTPVSYRKPHIMRNRLGLDYPVAWSLNHWNPVRDWPEHVRTALRAIDESNAGWFDEDYVIAMTEPNVGAGVGLWEPQQALEMTLQAIALDDHRPRWWTCDPTHEGSDREFAITDQLAEQAPDAIHTIGLNIHGINLARPVREILQIAQSRYPGRNIAITETSWHEGAVGHTDYARSLGITSRRGWLFYIINEIEASGVPITGLCWYPWLDMAFEPGPAWPNGYPH